MSRAWCRWCGAEIRWAKTTNDKNIPLDPCPTLDGRWRISLGAPTTCTASPGNAPRSWEKDCTWRTWKPAHAKPTNPT